MVPAVAFVVLFTLAVPPAAAKPNSVGDGVGVVPPEPVVVAPRLIRMDSPSSWASPTSVDCASFAQWINTTESAGAVYSKRSCCAVTATPLNCTV